MAEREERRFVELPRESLRAVAEGAGLGPDLGDEVLALLAEDVCYRLREATQNSSQFLKHTRRRRLTVEDFNRALRWSNVEAVCGYGSQESLPFRAIKDGDLYFQEDREVNLVELALATNIPKGCGHTSVTVQVSYLDGKGNLEPQGAVPSAVSTLTEDLLKYYQSITRAVLGDDPHLMKVALQDLQTNSKIAALLPYFVYVVSGVKSVSHDLEQLNRLLHIARSLVLNPFLALGSYVRSLVASVTYCALEPLAASINPLNDHWTLRDAAAILLSRIFWSPGAQLGALYQQLLVALQKVLADPVRPLCSHYGAVVGLHALGWKAVEQVLYPQLPSYWGALQGVLDDLSVSNAQVKADGHKVYGAILVAVERLLKTKAAQAPPPPPDPAPDSPPPAPSSSQYPPVGGTGGTQWAPPRTPPLLLMYRELYDFFGDSLATRFGTGMLPVHPSKPPHSHSHSSDPMRRDPTPVTPILGDTGAARKMPQLTANPLVGEDDDEEEEEEDDGGLPVPAPPHPVTSQQRPNMLGARGAPSKGLGARDAFPKGRLVTPSRGLPRFSFIIAGRQTGRRCQGRRFQTSFSQYHPGTGNQCRYGQKLPMIGRGGGGGARPGYRWPRVDYSLLFLL